MLGGQKGESLSRICHGLFPVNSPCYRTLGCNTVRPLKRPKSVTFNVRCGLPGERTWLPPSGRHGLERPAHHAVRQFAATPDRRLRYPARNSCQPRLLGPRGRLRRPDDRQPKTIAGQRARHCIPKLSDILVGVVKNCALAGESSERRVIRRRMLVSTKHDPIAI